MWRFKFVLKIIGQSILILAPIFIFIFFAYVQDDSFSIPLYVRNMLYAVCIVLLFISSCIQTNIRNKQGDVKLIRILFTNVKFWILLVLIIFFLMFGLVYTGFPWVLTIIVVLSVLLVISIGFKYMREYHDGESTFLVIYWALTIITIIISIAKWLNISVTMK